MGNEKFKPELQEPKYEIKDVRIRFGDYIGNVLNGLEGDLWLLNEPKFADNEQMIIVEKP